MLNTLFHIEGYIIANNDIVIYLNNYLDSKKKELSDGVITIPEYNVLEREVRLLTNHFKDMRDSYNELLTSQRNRIQEY
jgi:hypothetical protein